MVIQWIVNWRNENASFHPMTKMGKRLTTTLIKLQPCTTECVNYSVLPYMALQAYGLRIWGQGLTFIVPPKAWIQFAQQSCCDSAADK